METIDYGMSFEELIKAHEEMESLMDLEDAYMMELESETEEARYSLAMAKAVSRRWSGAPMIGEFLEA